MIGKCWGICGVCGREVKVRRDGLLYVHSYTSSRGYRTCFGGGWSPEKVVSDERGSDA